MVPLAGGLLDGVGVQPAVHLANAVGLLMGLGLLDLRADWTCVSVFVLLSMSRQLVFGTSFAGVMSWFGHGNFGQLMAVQKGLTALLGLAQYALADYSISQGDYSMANWVLLGAVVPLALGAFLLPRPSPKTPRLTQASCSTRSAPAAAH